MSLQVGNLLGAVTNATTAMSKETSLKSFLDMVNDFGILVLNNFLVNFSGLEDITFYVQSISLPTIKANTTDIYYNGRSVPVSINYDYEHDFTMTMINDANGYFYTAVSLFIMSNASNELVNSGYTMTIKALTGDNKYKGSLITCTGVKLTGIDGLQFGLSNNEILTFNVTGKMLEYSVTPGAFGTVASILGTVNSLIS